MFSKSHTHALSPSGRKIRGSALTPRWSPTPASIEDPQHAPRFAAQAQMAAAPPGFSLPLLPSGPDGVQRPELRRSRPSTPFAAAGSENPDLSDGIRPG